MLFNLCIVLPDSPIRKELTSQGSRKVSSRTNYLLSDAQSILFSEISTLIGKNKSIPNIADIAMNLLFESEAFFPNPEIIGIFLPKCEVAADSINNNLPTGMIDFWQSFISLLHDKKLLDELIWRLIGLVDTTQEDHNRKLIASLWIKAICQALVKLRITQAVTQAMEHSLDDDQKRMASRQLVHRVRDEVNKTHSELSQAMWFNTGSIVPAFLKDLCFVENLLINANELTRKFIQPILDLITPPINPKRKDYLLKLVRIHTTAGILKENKSLSDDHQTYSVEDLRNVCGTWTDDRPENNENVVPQRLFIPEVVDRTIRNSKWQIASGKLTEGSINSRPLRNNYNYFSRLRLGRVCFWCSSLASRIPDPSGVLDSGVTKATDNIQGIDDCTRHPRREKPQNSESR